MDTLTQTQAKKVVSLLKLERELKTYEREEDTINVWLREKPLTMGDVEAALRRGKRVGNLIAEINKLREDLGLTKEEIVL